jgi:hypothetical protein
MSLNSVIISVKVLSSYALAFNGDNVIRPDPGALGETHLQNASPSTVIFFADHAECSSEECSARDRGEIVL